MAKEPLQEKELQIKKTARRRLVGAIAMVVILLIVLPFLLKEQASDSAQEPVKITIVNEGVNSEPIPELEDSAHGFESNVNPTEVTGYTQPTVLPSQHDESANANASDSKTKTPLTQPQSPLTSLPTPTSGATEATSSNKENELSLKKQQEQAKIEVEAKQKVELEKHQAEKLAQEKIKQEKIKQEQAKQENALQEEKIKQEKAKLEQDKLEKNKQDKAGATKTSTAGKFYVQFGVFSDPKNLEKLQSDLNDKGFAVEKDNVDATGKKIRLRSRSYSTKEDALNALRSVQAAGFNAIVTAK